MGWALFGEIKDLSEDIDYLLGNGREGIGVGSGVGWGDIGPGVIIIISIVDGNVITGGKG